MTEFAEACRQEPMISAPVARNLSIATDVDEPLGVHSRWPRFEQDEIDAVVRVLASGKINALVHGEETRNLEREFAGYVGAPHGICMANGTVTLEIALRALGVGTGDEVILPARSFFATASCVLLTGATPVFADIDAYSQNIDPDSVERLIGPRTKAVICVHLAGWPCDMNRLRGLCDANGLFLIEDCAQAHGATFDGRKVGSFGDAASFSFCTDKIMSTGGEGGILLVQDEAVWERAWSLKDHGKNRQKLTEGKGRAGEFRYVHDRPGTNARMTEMQAAIGRCQLFKLPRWLDARRRNAQLLTSALAGCSRLLVPNVPLNCRHAWYKYYVQLQPRLAADRSHIISRLAEYGIPCSSGSCPDMSREDGLAASNCRRDGDLPGAASLGERTLMFPIDHTLSRSDMERIADALLTVIEC